MPEYPASDQPPPTGPPPSSGSGRPAAGDSTQQPGVFADLFQTRYREVTISAIVFAIIIGVVMNAAITYAGLKIGFTIGGSAIAAVLGFGVLRGILRRGTILETNMAQTIASAVNTSNSGVIFTVPVLLLMGYHFSIMGADFWLITLACVAGAILGTAFIIPLRKQMLDIERLRFPSPTAVASILKSPGAGPAKAVVLVVGVLIGAAIYLPVGLPSVSRLATLAELDQLYEEGRITQQQRDLTRDLATWIERGAAPGQLLNRGKLVADLRELEKAQDEAAEAHAAGEAFEGPVPTDAQVELLRLQIKRMAADSAYDDAIALNAYLATRGEIEWAALQNRSVGWATTSLPGYSRLNIRLPAEQVASTAGPAASDQPGESEGGGVPVLPQDGMPLGDPGQSGLVPPPVADGSDGASSDELSADDLMRSVAQSSTPVLPAAMAQPATQGRPNLTTRVDRNHDGIPDLLVTDSTIDVGRMVGLPEEYRLLFAIAPFALGAGYLTGRAGLFVLAGGILAFFVLNPLAFNMGWMPSSVTDWQAPDYGFQAYNRPLGIGLLLGGAMMGIIASFPALRAALRSIAVASKLKGGSEELGIKTLVVAVLAAILFLFVAADLMGNRPLNPNTCPVTGETITDQVETASYKGYAIGFATEEARAEWISWDDADRDDFLESMNARPGWLSGLNPHLRALLIALIGAAWIWFAGIIIAQCAGMTDWSPISGLALLTVVLVLLLAGTGAVLGAVLLGAALCVAITLSADMMGDMKTGYLVGAKPKRQQIIELMVVGIGPVIAMLTVLVIANVNLIEHGVAMGPDTPTSAPQAQALQVVISGVQGGEMPYALYGMGAALGLLLGMGAFSGLGVLIGLSMYLPFMYIATYGVGCIIQIITAKIMGRQWAESWGVPFCAGLIVGESILALIINLYVLGTGV